MKNSHDDRNSDRPPEATANPSDRWRAVMRARFIALVLVTGAIVGAVGTRSSAISQGATREDHITWVADA